MNNLQVTTNAKPNLTLEIPGNLNIDMSLTLHTLQARKLSLGIRTEKGSIGLWSFATAVKKIWQAAAQDDPYADWQLLKIYDALKNAEQYLRCQIEGMKRALQAVSYFTFQTVESVKPLVLPLNFSNPYGYLAAEMIGLLDELTRVLFTAKTIGMKTAKAFHQEIRQAMHYILKIFNKAYQWKNFSLNRQNVMEKSANSLAAQERFGELPEIILTKKLRAPLSPFIMKVEQ